MLREISEEVRVTLKDRLRDVRHVIRQHRHDGSATPSARLGDILPLPRPPFAPAAVDHLVGHAVSAFDDAMTLAERLTPVRRPAPPAGAAQGFATYFPPGEAREGARAFRRDLYYLAREVLANRRVTDARIHESELAAVHATMRTRHGNLIAGIAGAADWAARIEAASAFSAALLLTMLDHRAIRLDDATLSSRDARTLELLCLVPVVLACGFATVEPDPSPEPDILDLTVLAAEARLDRIADACAGADGQAELTRIFATLLAHLP